MTATPGSAAGRPGARALAARGRQQGMTLWSLLYVVITLGLLVLVGIKSLPVYLNAYDIRSTLDRVAAAPELKDATATDIQRAVQRRFDAGYVDNIEGRDVAVSRVGDGREISVSYEQRRTMLFNIDMVYSFEESARLSGNGGE